MRQEGTKDSTVISSPGQDLLVEMHQLSVYCDKVLLLKTWVCKDRGLGGGREGREGERGKTGRMGEGSGGVGNRGKRGNSHTTCIYSLSGLS